jgi:hypothetical protein
VDENAVRSLLMLAASDEQAPPCEVSVVLARSRGRRRLRRGRIYLPGAAPVAAAVAVVLVVTLSTVLSGGVPGRSVPAVVPPRAVVPLVAPTTFNPLVPYASFGWLPAGFADTASAGASDQSTSTSVTLQALAPPSDGRMVTVSIDAAGACRVRPAASSATTPRSVGTLSCAGAADGSGTRYADLVSAAPDVNGRPAYWTLQGALDFAYAGGAWAEVLPMANPYTCVHCAPNNLAGWGNVLRKPANRTGVKPVLAQVAQPESPASQLLLFKIAASLRYGDTTSLVFGFEFAGLPGGWQVASEYYFAPKSGLLAAAGLSAGPAVDPSALSISIGPAVATTSDYACKYVAGQSAAVTLDGAPALLRTLDDPDKHWQSLCANDVGGVQPYLTLDLNTPGSNAPLPGGDQLGTLLTVFGNVHLLGPDPTSWTTVPLK